MKLNMKTLTNNFPLKVLTTLLLLSTYICSNAQIKPISLTERKANEIISAMSIDSFKTFMNELYINLVNLNMLYQIGQENVKIELQNNILLGYAAINYIEINRVNQSDIYYDAGMFYSFINDTTKTIRYLSKAIEENNFLNTDRLKMAYSLRGELRYFIGDYFGAIMDVTKSMEIPNTSDWYEKTGEEELLIRAKSLLRLSKFEDAISDINQVLNLNKKNKQALYIKGVILLNNIETKEEGCISLSKAYELGDEHALVLIKKYCH
jgi:tetratricopeptide (TPR) repeat protein